MKRFIEILAEEIYADEIDSQESVEDIKRELTEEMLSEEGQKVIGVFAKWYKEKTGEDLDTSLE